MKLIKFAPAAIVAAFALCGFRASASGGCLVPFEKLNFNLTTYKQGPSSYVTNSRTATSKRVYTILTTRMVNKDILALLADEFDQTWPANAQLAIQRHNEHLCIVTNGTNMYFDAGLWRNWTNYDCKVKVEWGCDDVYSGSCSYTSKTNKDTQDISKTSYRVAQLRMYSWNTDDMLELNGFDTRNFTFSGVETPAKITLKETVADNIPVYGQLYWDEVFYMIQGTITGIGSGTLIESSP